MHPTYLGWQVEWPVFIKRPLMADSKTWKQGDYFNWFERGIDADKVAFSGARVMVNMNQTGEAAGVAAYLALESDSTVQDVDPLKLRTTMAEGGSIII